MQPFFRSATRELRKIESRKRAAAAQERDSNNVSVYGFAGMSDATRAPDGKWSLSLFI
jgi:hypothetical protein